MSEMQKGPKLSDQGGELTDPILVCEGCEFLRQHDFHYSFCAGQGGKPTYWTKENVVQLYRGPYPNTTCPYLKEPTP